jgi:hypothetical protein
MRSLCRLLLVTAAWFVLPGPANLSAAGGCWCHGTGDAYVYGTEERVGHVVDYGFAGGAGSQWQCADMCQLWVNENLGGAACAQGGLGAGQGFALESWEWIYGPTYITGGPPVQQYDCGDL